MSKGYVKFWGVRGSNPTPDKNKMEYQMNQEVKEFTIATPTAPIKNKKQQQNEKTLREYVSPDEERRNKYINIEKLEKTLFNMLICFQMSTNLN